MAFFDKAMTRAATISVCGRYRYSLWRVWNTSKPLLCWVMLNPSKANATEDDHTIRWCIRYAAENGYGGIVVVNLFAFRATMPADMKAAADPIGPDNDAMLAAVLKDVVRTGGKVLVAWGVHGEFQDRDREVLKVITKYYRQAPLCLDVTIKGHPKHPARLSPRLKLRAYEGRP